MLSDTIKKLRLEKGLTQSELGELIGVKKAAIQKYESGTVKNLKQETIFKISKVFNITPAMLIALSNEEEIRSEVLLIEEIQLKYGKDTVELLNSFTELNDDMKSKVIDYSRDMLNAQGVKYNK